LRRNAAKDRCIREVETMHASKNVTVGIFNNLVSLREMQELARSEFISETVLYWFVRQHRKELALAGALLNFRGELRFRPEKFAEVAEKIAARRAALEPK
jgi:hypothetical protein